MAKRKRIIISLVLIGICLAALSLVTSYPIVFQSSNRALVKRHYDSSVFNPLREMKLDEGDWSIYLLIDKSDFEKLTPELKPCKVSKVTSRSVLEQLQNAWNFKPTGGDVATASSSLVVVLDGQVIFETGVVLDENMVGFQSEDFGWAEPIDKKKFVETLKKFKEVQSPLIFI